MASKRLCIICRSNPAELPDRNRMGRPIKRVCRQCHRNRLYDDLRNIAVTAEALARQKARRDENG